MLRKIVLLALALCMILSVVGCNPSSEKTAASSKGSLSADSETESSEDMSEEEEESQEEESAEDEYQEDESSSDDKPSKVSSSKSSKKSSKVSASKSSKQKSSKISASKSSRDESSKDKASSKKSSSKKSSSKKSSSKKSSSKKSSSKKSSSESYLSAPSVDEDNYSESSPETNPSPIIPGHGDMSGVKDPMHGDADSTSLWGNPYTYVIIFPAGDTAARESAMRVKKYFSENFSADLLVLSDGNEETANEILVGKTNRPNSNRDIAQNSYEVSMKGKNLVFDGGHQAALDQAIQLFVEKAPKSSSQVAISGSLTDFKPKMLGEYDYVWGDEFVTKELDFTRWTLAAKMGGTDTIKVSSGRQTIDMADGNLVLRALKSANKGKKEYLVPTSVVTQFNMMYTYGYCEIRAKVPNAIGVWPSFWTQSNTGVGKRKCFDYFVEVDIFEVFGDPDGKFIPNLHKWYTTAAGGKHVVSGAKNNVPLNNSMNEYHTYGYEWTPTEMSMYVDGVKYETYDITNNATIKNNPTDEMKGFHDPQFLIFNNHVFAEDSSYIANYKGKKSLIENNESVLPAEYYIDYFRLYQKKGEGKIWTSSDVKYTYPERD